jgi:hypothetical protein
VSLLEAVRFVVSHWPGLGQREVGWELRHQLGRPDLADTLTHCTIQKIGGWVDGIGCWGLPPDRFSASSEVIYSRLLLLETLTYALPDRAQWGRRRLALITRWLEEDARRGRLLLAA